jgi:hypothetical protein
MSTSSSQSEKPSNKTPTRASFIEDCGSLLRTTSEGSDDQLNHDAEDFLEGSETETEMSDRRSDKRRDGSKSSKSRSKSSSKSSTSSSNSKSKMDDWSEVLEPDERRRIQNRIAQRKFSKLQPFSFFIFQNFHIRRDSSRSSFLLRYLF